MATTEPRPTKKKGRAGGLVVLLALVAAGAWFLKDFGFGTGGTGTGEVDRAAPTDTTATPPTNSNELRVVVDREGCVDPGGQPEDCAATCKRLTEEADGARVVIDARVGTHGTVETLRTCLVDAGISDIRIEGGPKTD